MFASSQYIGQNAVANTGGVQQLGHFRRSRADDGLLCGKASLDLTVGGGYSAGRFGGLLRPYSANQ